MDIGILGAGTVGQTVGAALAGLGHSVTLGTRRPDATGDERGRAGSLEEWLERTGARVASYADAAESGELVVNATPGSVSLDVLAGIGPAALAGKILLDIANPLDFSDGFPPSLTVANTDSLAERIQRACPDAVAGRLREWFGWRDILDLGGLSAARGMEAYLLLWVRAMSAQDTAMFNVKVVR